MNTTKQKTEKKSELLPAEAARIGQRREDCNNKDADENMVKDWNGKCGKWIARLVMG